MTAFTVEIAGTAIACICAADFQSAEDISNEPWFCTDLISLRYEGRALWDGRSAKHLRRATLAELRIVQDRLSALRREMANDPEDTVFYLIPVS